MGIRPKIEAIKTHVLELENAKSKIALQLEEKSAALENIISVSKIKDTTVDELRASKKAMEEDNADLKLAIQSLSNQVRESEAKSNENDLKNMEIKNEELKSKLENEMKKSLEIHDQLTLEIEKLEVSLKEKRDELSSKEEKLDEYKNELEFKTTRINDLEQISKQNEESHIN